MRVVRMCGGWSSRWSLTTASGDWGRPYREDGLIIYPFGIAILRRSR